MCDLPWVCSLSLAALLEKDGDRVKDRPLFSWGEIHVSVLTLASQSKGRCAGVGVREGMAGREMLRGSEDRWGLSSISSIPTRRKQTQQAGLF